MRRVVGVAPWGARSSSLPGYLWLSISICLLFLMFSLVWLGLVPALASPPPSPLPLLRSGRGFGLCRLFPFPGAGLAAPSLCGDCSSALLRQRPPAAAPRPLSRPSGFIESAVPRPKPVACCLRPRYRTTETASLIRAHNPKACRASQPCSAASPRVPGTLYR